MNVLEQLEKAIKDMVGEKPHAGMSIERIDNSKGYSPENCIWATQKEQCNNTRQVRQLEYQGSMINIQKLIEITGMKRKVLYNRIFELGWTVERAVSEPVGPPRRKKTAPPLI